MNGDTMLVCVAYTVIIFGIGFARGYLQGRADGRAGRGNHE